jgi:hypothetical protein
MRVLEFNEVKDKGFEPKDYSGDPLPEGSWVGILEFRVWGKERKCIHCYFKDQDGDKRKITAFPCERGTYEGVEGAFTARDGHVNFGKDNLEDLPFSLTTGKNGKGKPAWIEAAEMKSEDIYVVDVSQMS